MKISFLKMFVGFMAACVIGIAVDTYAATPEPASEVVVVTAIEMGRGGDPDLATILTKDGNLYWVECPYEDAFHGDLWLCSRTGDRFTVIGSLGYEIWDATRKCYEWHLWSRQIGDYVVTYSQY